jgi:hypothetical protein
MSSKCGLTIRGNFKIENAEYRTVLRTRELGKEEGVEASSLNKSRKMKRARRRTRSGET